MKRQWGKWVGHQFVSNTVVSEDIFGVTSNGEQVKRYKLCNKICQIEVELITLGGAITVIKVPDKDGKLQDVNLGFDNVQGYEAIPNGNPYLGALCGRVANRIGKAKYTYKGKEYLLSANEGQNQLHGGANNWSMAVWQGQIHNNSVILTHTSKDGDQGFPGTVTTNVTHELTDQGELTLQFEATTDKTTPIDLTSHAYFNLDGEGSGDIYDHVVTLYCDRYLPVDDELIPTGEIAKVNNTPFDLREPTVLRDVMKKVPIGGFMHTFCVNGPTGKRKVARVHSSGSGIVMDVFTDQPAVIFYTADRTDIKNAKKGHSYPKHSSFCLETQNYPEAVNVPSFPDPFLIPESVYEHTVCYKFSTQK